MRLRSAARNSAIIFSLTLAAVLTVGPATATPASSATRGYVYDANTHELVVFNPADNTVTDRIALGFDTPAYTIRPDEREIYVADYANDRVAVISTESDTVVAAIAVGERPQTVVFTRDSRKAYVVTGQTVTVIDTGTRLVTTEIKLGEAFGQGADVSPDGSRLYLGTTSLDGGPKAVTVISTATDTITRSISLGADALPPAQVTFAPDGRLALVSSGHVINTATETVVRVIPLQFAWGNFTFAPDSRRVYVAKPCGPTAQGSLQLIDVVTGQVVRTLVSGDNPDWVDLTPDNSQIYVVLHDGGAIAVLDAATEHVVDTFGTTAAPHLPSLDLVELAGTLPAPGPGQRFAPQPVRSHICEP